MSTTILIADDDPDIAKMYALALSQLGEVVVAHNGLEALSLLAERHFDVLVLDLYMPGVGGFDVMDRLAETDHRNHGLSVFVITADQSDTTRAQTLKRGAIYQFTKPVPLRVLVDQVKSHLERRARSSHRI